MLFFIPKISSFPSTFQKIIYFGGSKMFFSSKKWNLTISSRFRQNFLPFVPLSGTFFENSSFLSSKPSQKLYIWECGAAGLPGGHLGREDWVRLGHRAQCWLQNPRWMPSSFGGSNLTSPKPALLLDWPAGSDRPKVCRSDMRKIHTRWNTLKACLRPG